MTNLSLERVTGFEPATSCLGSKHSTAELHPQAGDIVAKSSQKFTTELLDKFITSRASGTSQKTTTLYHFALDRFIGYPLTPEGINAYLDSLTCGNAKHNYFRCIKTLCRWLYQNDYIQSNPIENVSPPRRQKKLLPAMSKEQLQILLNNCHCKRDRAVINLLWYAGMRLSEVANVQASNFNWKEGTVIVLGKGNRYRKALAGNGVVREWFQKHNSFEITTRGIQATLQSGLTPIFATCSHLLLRAKGIAIRSDERLLHEIAASLRSSQRWGRGETLLAKVEGGAAHNAW